MGRPTVERLREAVAYDPETGVFTRRSNGRVVGSKHVSRGSTHLIFSVDGYPVRANRAAWAYMTGEWPSEWVDHKDRDSLNNRWGNLRLAMPQQSAANRTYPVGEAGYPGVHKYRGRFRSKFRGQMLGAFDTPEEAFAAYRLARSDFHRRYQALDFLEANR